MNKRRSPKEIIEREDPHIENGFIKFPGHELIKISLPASSGTHHALYDQKRISSLVEKYGREYTDIHTHIHEEPAPSMQDISAFLRTKKARTMIVANVDEDSGKLKGYFILRKKEKEFPEHIKYKDGLRGLQSNAAENAKSRRAHREREEQVAQRAKKWYWRTLEDLGFVKLTSYADPSNTLYPLPKSAEEETREGIEMYGRNMHAGRWKGALKELAQRFNLQSRIIPAEGYEFVDGTFEKKHKKGLEEKVTIVITIGGLVGGFFFLSTNLTGNVVGSLSNPPVNWLGATLFAVGLVGAFLGMKKRK